MKTRLLETYPGGVIEVNDLTGTQDHYEVYIASPAFTGMTRIQAHKHVMHAFSAELASGEIHALTIRTEAK